VLLVTHDLGEAVFLAERITLLHEGRIIQTGTYRQLLSSQPTPLSAPSSTRSALCPMLVRWHEAPDCAVAVCIGLCANAYSAPAIVVGSKIFTEGYRAR